MESWLEPLHDAESMRAVDSWAIEERGVPSLELMEAAGRAVAEATEAVAGDGPVRVVCGKGNNGGDGLVAARHLAGAGHRGRRPLAVAGRRAQRRRGGQPRAPRRLGATSCAASRRRRLSPARGRSSTRSSAPASRARPREPAAGAIGAINDCAAPVVAADIASGVDASTGEVEGAAVEATVTVSFHAAKLGHWIAPGKRHTGELEVAAIGIPDDGPAEAPGGLLAQLGARACSPAATPTRPSSARARCWSPAGRAG